MKRMLSMLMALVMALSLFPAMPAHAEESESQNTVCEERGHHFWHSGTCLQRDWCAICGVERDSYGPHTFGTTDFNCEKERICAICQLYVPAKEHTYENITDLSCDVCYDSRIVACVNEPIQVRLETPARDQPPKFSQHSGMTAVCLNGFSAVSGYIWDFELTFRETGRYEVLVEIPGKPETYDVHIIDHSIRPDNGCCEYCGWKDESFHVHTWQNPTCMAPKTCSECGATEGEKNAHYFYTDKCMTEPAVCTMCGLAQEGPPGHFYMGSYDGKCTRCDQRRIFGCTEGGAEDWFSSYDEKGFSFVEADPELTVSQGEYLLEGQTHCWQYLFASTQPGQYEAAFVNNATGEQKRLTVKIEPHAFVDGKCCYCNQTDPNVHFHQWVSATCTEYGYCETCGELLGSPMGHWVSEGPCSEPRTCVRCDFVIEPPSHQYPNDRDSDCRFCGQHRFCASACAGGECIVILSSTEGGDFYVDGPDGGLQLALLDFYVEQGIYYWRYAVTAPGPGTYEVNLKQKDSTLTAGLIVHIVQHEFADGLCQNCGSAETGGHIHTWKSATCTKGATCTQCGEVQGEPLDHDYHGYACQEYALCGRCHTTRGRIPHTYDGWNDLECNLCSQARAVACEGQELDVYLYNDNQLGGFYLIDAPAGVSMKLATTDSMGPDRGFRHKYKVKISRAGTFELQFLSPGSTETVPYTAQVFYHEYEGGDCRNCGKPEPGIHHHQWVSATCLAPKTCSTCGITEGEPIGHNWREADCTHPRYCFNCSLTEGKALGHDVFIWSCKEPGICRRCNSFQEHDAGHGPDEQCIYCGKQTEGIAGDVDYDGQVTYLDAMEVLKAAVGLVTLTQEQFSLADTDGDGEVTYLDAMQILRWSVGLTG